PWRVVGGGAGFAKEPQEAPAGSLRRHNGDGARFGDVNEVAVVLVAEHFDAVFLGVLVEVGLAGLADAQLDGVQPDGVFQFRRLAVNRRQLISGDHARQEAGVGLPQSLNAVTIYPSAPVSCSTV